MIIFSTVGCTRLGITNNNGPSSLVDLGQNVALRVCMYKDAKVSDKQAADIIGAVQKEFSQYGLILHVPIMKAWQRPSFRHEGIINDIANRPLETPCDRAMALVGRDFRDFLWGALLPEVLGAVETRTHTKGFVVAEMGSLNQMLSFSGPTTGAIHEFYHLLGATHSDGSETTASKIARLKHLALLNRFSGHDFFPSIGNNGTVYFSRRAVDEQFGLATNNQTPIGLP